MTIDEILAAPEVDEWDESRGSDLDEKLARIVLPKTPSEYRHISQQATDLIWGLRRTVREWVDTPTEKRHSKMAEAASALGLYIFRLEMAVLSSYGLAKFREIRQAKIVPPMPKRKPPGPKRAKAQLVVYSDLSDSSVLCDATEDLGGCGMFLEED